MEIDASESILCKQVADHYNKIEELGSLVRKQSRIYYLRNFNNWIKTVILSEAFNYLNQKFSFLPTKVLDIGCGKGGDLIKYSKLNLKHLVCVDIAKTSLSHCKTRFESQALCNRYSVELIAADCSRESVKMKLKDPSMKFHLVCTQFSFHYCFESLPQAEQMIRNAAENLEVGGLFLGTTVDAYELIKRLKESDKNSFSNDVFSISFPEEFDKNNIPLFGVKYDFHLHEVVNCPEFLVYFPVVVEIAKRYNLELVYTKTFKNIFDEFHNSENYLTLLQRMKALETYPTDDGVQKGNEDDYMHAEEFLKSHDCNKIGTLSLAEWEVASIYLAFLFRKVKSIKT